ncbi:MAG: DUF6786 family protein [bacterium]
METKQPTFSEDLSFLSRHTDVVLLTDSAGTAQVVVIPNMQARVMTSTLAGPGGLSLGWINKELIASGKILPHFNPYGGEDRFWLGPEAGQFGIFFKKDFPFDLDNWYTPSAIDTEPFDLVARDGDGASFKKSIRLENYSGTQFNLEVEREIRLLGFSEMAIKLGISPDAAIQAVAYQSDNKITNTGRTAWEKESGLLSIWILGMFNPSPTTTVVIPFRDGDEENLGPIVNDTYFGKVPSDRLAIAKGMLYFKGDGKYRSKIGLSPQRAKPILGSYDETNQVLTLVQYTKPEGAVDYVNSMWEIQSKPYGGDVVNSYNDGPPEPDAKPLGPFYELETSSRAAELNPGESLSHIHLTFHFKGPENKLDEISEATLGVSVQEIKFAFK